MTRQRTVRCGKSRPAILTQRVGALPVEKVDSTVNQLHRPRCWAEEDAGSFRLPCRARFEGLAADWLRLPLQVRHPPTTFSCIR
jgi:hypothetical protein